MRDGRKVAVDDPLTGELSFTGEGFPAVYPDVGGLFEWIEQRIDENVLHLGVSYDPVRGYPSEIVTDFNDFVDNEFIHRVLALTPNDSRIPSLEERLTAHRLQWEERRIEDYDFMLERGCNCPPESWGPVLIRVRGGVAVSRIDTRTCEPLADALAPLFPTVDGLFDLVQKAIDQRTETITVEFETAQGYPARILIDPGPGGGVGGVGLFVTGFTPLAEGA